MNTSNNYYIIASSNLIDKFPDLVLWSGGPTHEQAQFFGENLSDHAVELIRNEPGTTKCVPTEHSPYEEFANE